MIISCCERVLFPLRLNHHIGGNTKRFPLLLLTALTVLAAVRSSDDGRKVIVLQGSMTYETMRNVGLLICKERCLRIGGCKSIKYYRHELKCELLSYEIKSTNTLAKITKGNTLNCNNNSPFSTILIVSRENRKVCVTKGFKAATKKQKQQTTKKTEVHTPQFVVASLDFNSTYYACAPNKLLMIQKQSQGSFEVQKIKAKNYRGRKLEDDNIVRGMTTAPCLHNIHSFCLYYLLDRKKGTKNTLKLCLKYYPEPNTYNIPGYRNMKSRTKLLSCGVSNSGSHVNGLTLDSDMNVFILHQRVLKQFKRSEQIYLTCTNVRHDIDVDGTQAIQLFYGRGILILTDHGATIYDIKRINKDGRLLMVFNHSRNRLHCVDTVKNTIVMVPTDDPRNVQICDINIYKIHARCG